jgi:acyl-CoA synthetase (AMP-forming)/AMP-acid ligase II
MTAIPAAGSAEVNFAATLAARARAHPHLTALIEPAPRRFPGRARWQRISYADLDALANLLVSRLAARGVRRGDRVLFFSYPSAETYASFYALLRIGAIPVFLDPRMGIRRLLACVSAVAARVVLAPRIVHPLRALLRRPFAASEVLISSGRRRLSRATEWSSWEAEPAAPLAPVGPGDPSIFPFTSGSTGPPKGVFYDHAMLRQQTQVMGDVCGWREAMPIVMCYAPFVPYGLADGLTVILPDVDFTRPAAMRPERVAGAINAHGAQCAFASPVVWMNLARFCERSGTVLPTLDRAVTAGAPVPIALHQRLLPFLHQQAQLFTPYGATEAMPLTSAGTGDLAATWAETARGYGTCVGAPLPGVTLRIIRVTDDAIPDWTDDLCVPDGEIGEVVVDASLASPSYPDCPDHTARAKIRRNERVLHRTGDLGRLDSCGRLWFCGRKAHRIETRHGMVPPDPIENIFNQHPAVFRSAAVGVGRPGSQLPVICVELEAGHTLSPRLEAELLGLTRGTCFEDSVARVLVHRGFPVDARHNSKIRRDELARWASRVLGSRAAQE